MVYEKTLFNDEYSQVKVYFTQKGNWDNKDLNELENDYNVFYNPNHVTPIRVEGMNTENPILYFGSEDDGWLTIDNKVVFSAYYLEPLIEQLKLIKQKIDETKNF